jgi:hypothetical protein
MLTTSEAADVLNLVEESAVNSLESDSWLQTGGTGGIGLIHRRTLGSERFYQAHELPVLCLASQEISPSEGATPAGARNVEVKLTIEAFEAGADHETVMENIKTVAARLHKWLSDQGTPGSNRLDGLIDDGDGVVSPVRIAVKDETKADQTYRASAKAEATIRLRAATS